MGAEDDAVTTRTRAAATRARDGREGRETGDDDDAEAARRDRGSGDDVVVVVRETGGWAMGASARDGDDAGDGVRDDGDDANDEEEEEEDFVGACRVCLFDVTREDIRDARAIRLGCACVSGVVHVDAECLEAWVLRAPRKSADCEICLERMTNVPTRAELRKERRLRREKYRARTVSSSSSASARDDDARDDDARARDLEIGAERIGDVSRGERCCLYACAPLACAYAIVHAFCAHRSCVFAFILLAIGVAVLTRASILL